MAPRAWGHYHGQWGFDTFNKLKPVFRQSRINGMALFLPPYRPLMRRLLGLMKQRGRRGAHVE